MGHILGTFYVNIEEKVWLLVVKKYGLKKTDRATETSLLTEIGRLHWNQGEEVAHFAWFGEPC